METSDELAAIINMEEDLGQNLGPLETSSDIIIDMEEIQEQDPGAQEEHQRKSEDYVVIDMRDPSPQEEHQRKSDDYVVIDMGDPSPQEEHQRKSDDYVVIDMEDPSPVEDYQRKASEEEYIVIDMGDSGSLEEEKQKKTWSKSTIVTMILLMLLQLQDNIDDSMVIILLPHIKKTFGFSLLQAESSSVMYVALLGLLAPVFGAICDCCNKKLIICIGMFFQILLSLGTSFLPRASDPTVTYVVFMMIRILACASNASYSTIPKTIIGDFFEGNKRTWMLAIFQITAIVGNGLAYIISHEVTYAMGGDWRWCLWISSGLSLSVWLLVCAFMKDPPMKNEGKTSFDYRTVKSCFCSFIGLFRNRSLMFSILGFTCLEVINQAITLWMPEYFSIARSELDQCQSWLCQLDDNSIFGILTILSAIIGGIGGVIICHRLRKNDPDNDSIVCALCLIGSCPILYLCFTFVDKSFVSSYLLLFSALVLLNMASLISESITLYVVPSSLWCCSEALEQLCTHLLGTLPGTFIFDLAKELFSQIDPSFTEFQCLKYSLMQCGSIAALGGLFYLATSMYIEEDRKKIESNSST